MIDRERQLEPVERKPVFWRHQPGVVDQQMEPVIGSEDFVGEAALITGEPRNATVVARTDLETYVLGKGDFRAAIEASASFRDQLYRVYFLRH